MYYLSFLSYVGFSLLLFKSITMGNQVKEVAVY